MKTKEKSLTKKQSACQLWPETGPPRDRTLLMGIVNTTPDSFSGDGLVNVDLAVKQAIDLAGQGADIIDFGGQSTRPGHVAVSAKQELDRVFPVLERFSARSTTPISIDSYEIEVCRAATAVGACIINSVRGLDDSLLELAIENDSYLVITHNKKEAVYDGCVVREVLRFLSGCAKRAMARGLNEDKVILDPGIGFGKLPEHNLKLLHSLKELVALGFPTLVGTSRKSFIGKLTGKEVHERELGTAASVAVAIAAGVNIVRVHDVAAMADVRLVADAIAKEWRPTDWSDNV